MKYKCNRKRCIAAQSAAMEQVRITLMTLLDKAAPLYVVDVTNIEQDPPSISLEQSSAIVNSKFMLDHHGSVSNALFHQVRFQHFEGVIR